MKVFGHDHVADDHELIAAAHPFQYFQEKVAACGRPQQGPTLVATAGDVVQMVGATVAFEALGHEEILGADAVCVCDGQTGPTRRKERDEWGTPGYLSIYSERMDGPPGHLAPSHRLPIKVFGRCSIDYAYRILFDVRYQPSLVPVLAQTLGKWIETPQ